MVLMVKLQDRIAKRVRELLAKKGMSADRLALEIEMSSGFMSEFLRGKKRISVDTLERLADGLEVDPKDLL